MSLENIVEIEQAIGRLTQQELGELYTWLDGKPNPLDQRIAADLSSGALDEAIGRALTDEQSGSVRLL